jgi:hypothetical protein
MTVRKSTVWGLAACVAVLMAALIATPRSSGDEGKRADGEGKYAQWTAEWWQWVYSLPIDNNPLFDETGALADTEQPNKKAFFLVGVINESGTAQRKITIPKNTPLFGPVINVQNDNIFYDPPVNVPQLRADAASFVDEAEFFLYLNGEARPDLLARIKSPVFSYDLPDNNIYQFFGTDITGRVKPSVSDGYWFYIPALPKGTHTLRFGGGFPSAGFSLEIEYEITVK